MARAGYRVKLFSCQWGTQELIGSSGDSSPNIRHQELIRAFPELVDPERVVSSNLYIIRKIALEQTNETHVVYALALALAVHTYAILYCLENNISDIACGYSGYQASRDAYIEQRDDFRALTEKFLGEYGITYHTPVIKMSELEVKDVLEQQSISSNSLENKCIFGGIPFNIQQSLPYWNRVLPMCTEYIESMRSSKS